MGFMSELPRSLAQRGFTEISDEVKVEINKIVAELLPDQSIDACNFSNSHDSLGEEIIVITLCYYEYKNEIDASILSELTRRCRACLVMNGDMRFPAFDHKYVDGQDFVKIG